MILVFKGAIFHFHGYGRKGSFREGSYFGKPPVQVDNLSSCVYPIGFMGLVSLPHIYHEINLNVGKHQSHGSYGSRIFILSGSMF